MEAQRAETFALYSLLYYQHTQEVLTVILSHAWIGESEAAVSTLPLSWTCLRPALQPPWRAGLPLPRCTTFWAAGIMWRSRPGFPAFCQVLALAAKGPETTGETRPRISSPGQSSSQPWLTEPSRYSKTRHVTWALKNGAFPECLVCARQCAPWFIFITSLKSHYNVAEPGNPLLQMSSGAFNSPPNTLLSHTNKTNTSTQWTRSLDGVIEVKGLGRLQCSHLHIRTMRSARFRN